MMNSPGVFGLFWLDHGVGHAGDKPSGALGGVQFRQRRCWIKVVLGEVVCADAGVFAIHRVLENFKWDG